MTTHKKRTAKLRRVERKIDALYEELKMISVGNMEERGPLLAKINQLTAISVKLMKRQTNLKLKAKERKAAQANQQAEEILKNIQTNAGHESNS